MRSKGATTEAVAESLVATGIQGLDDILRGGYAPSRMFLVEGEPGSGKTTLALQFALEGARRGERVLYLALSETEEELRAAVASHGWSLEGVDVRELASEDKLSRDQRYTMFHPSEVELGELTKTILAAVDERMPTRVVIDSLSELRQLAQTSLNYRREILALKRFFIGRSCTTLMLDDRTSEIQDLQLRSIAHGVLLLEQMHPEYGAERRRLCVIKYRGLQFRGGYHDFVIRRGGLEVFPRLIAAELRGRASLERLSSGIAELDLLLGGGIERGTSTLIVGAAGTGKSSIASQFVATAAERGQTAAMFIFDEGLGTLLARSAGLGIDLEKHVRAGRVTIQSVDPAELSPGEFAHALRRATRDHAAIVVIDSLNGYMNAMPEERFVTIQLHELLTYLSQAGVATLLIGAHKGLIGSQMQTPVDASYLADAVILLRYFEAKAEVRQAISVVKKRGGNHERTIREFRLDQGGIRVGEPLRKFRGVLSGLPVYDGKES